MLPRVFAQEKKNQSAVFLLRWKPLMTGGRFCYQIHLPLACHLPRRLFCFVFLRFAECFIFNFRICYKTNHCSVFDYYSSWPLTWSLALSNISPWENNCVITSFKTETLCSRVSHLFSPLLITLPDGKWTCLCFPPPQAYIRGTRAVFASADWPPVCVFQVKPAPWLQLWSSTEEGGCACLRMLPGSPDRHVTLENLTPSADPLVAFTFIFSLPWPAERVASLFVELFLICQEELLFWTCCFSLFMPRATKAAVGGIARSGWPVVVCCCSWDSCSTWCSPRASGSTWSTPSCPRATERYEASEESSTMRSWPRWNSTSECHMPPRPSESAASSLRKLRARGKRSATPHSLRRSVPRMCMGFCPRSCCRCGSPTTWMPQRRTFRTRARTAYTSTSTYPLRTVSEKKEKHFFSFNLSVFFFAFKKGQNKVSMKHFQSVRAASTPFKCFKLYMCPSHCIVRIVL